ncbi:MAG: hypothetical protein BWZ01_03161 [Deltaproteobacteria bacterium ADurb.BinA179]|nr:MAG: hypothetical protein BWZ01_03161 [Deltaproteobacteria bacterium ADurb.BinA179]
MVFGVISEKMSRITVMAREANRMPSSPKIDMNSAVAMADPRMLTKLLPSRITLMRLSGFSRMVSTLLASRFPFSERLLIRNRLARMNAVSLPEKNAERMMITTRITA